MRIRISLVTLAFLGTAALPALSSDLPLRIEWYRSGLSGPVALEGLASADLDGDGDAELLVSSENDSWLVFEWSGDGYRQTWASLPFESRLSAIRAVRLGSETIILVGTADGTLSLIDGVTHRAFRTIPTGAQAFHGLTVAPLGESAAPTAFFCDDDHVFRVDLLSGALAPTVTTPCSDLAVGQVDDDPELEVVVAGNTEPDYVFDAATMAVEWTNNLGFGFRVAVGDLDSDGRDEIVAGYPSYDGLTVFDAEMHTIAYTVPVDYLANLVLADVDQDGNLEIVYGEAQSGPVHVLDGASGAEEWSVANPAGSLSRIAVGNLDGDPALEVVWGAGGSSGIANALFVADGATHEIEWRDDAPGPGVSTVGGADVDGDGDTELFYGVVSTVAHPYSGRYRVLDGADRTLELDGSFLPYGDLTRVTTGDVAGSSDPELLLAGNVSYNGTLLCRSLDGDDLWSVTLPSGTGLGSVAVADVDDDGEPEVAAGTTTLTSGAHSIYFDVFDGATGALEWQSPNLGAGTAYSLLRLADVDDDDALEAVLGGSWGRVWVWDLESHLDEAVTLDLDVTALDVADVDGDGEGEIFIGTDDGLVRSVDVATSDPTTVAGPFGAPIDGLVVDDFTGDGVADYLIGVAGRLLVVDGDDQAVRWTSALLGDDVGTNDTLRRVDVDGDGFREVLASNFRGVLLLGNDDRDAQLSRDGFETGTLLKWSTDPLPAITD